MSKAPATKVIRFEIGSRPVDYHIYLGDTDISRFVRGFKIEHAVGSSIPEVTLYCVGLVQLPEELNALVYAEVESEYFKEL